jgi:rRNA maturation endonuclease Nob1
LKLALLLNFNVIQMKTGVKRIIMWVCTTGKTSVKLCALCGKNLKKRTTEDTEEHRENTFENAVEKKTQQALSLKRECCNFLAK